MPNFYDNALLAALVDKQNVDLASIAAAIDSRADVSLAALVELFQRLPTGLIHAEEVYVLPEAPPEFSPLAPNSAWYASERSLIVAMPGGLGLEALLTDLGAYYRIARHVHERLVLREDLAQVLDGTLDDNLAKTEVALLLGVSGSELAALDAALLRDVAWMARRAFEPDIRVHAELCPSEQAARGRAIGESLLARVPRGTFLLAIADDETAVEVLSPYTRDLGHALYAWTLENRAVIRTRGLVDAVEAAPDAPNDDVASLVVRELFREAPDLRAERREQEATQGLWLEDLGGLTYGVADLGALEAPDPRLFGEPQTGTVVVLAGGPPTVLWSAARHVIESARVAGLAGVFGGDLDDDRPVIAQALVSDDDAIRFGSARALLDIAAEIEMRVTPAGPIPARQHGPAPALAMDVFATVRKNRVLGTVDPETPVYLILYSNRSIGFDREMSRLDAARLGFRALLMPPPEKPSGGRKPAKSDKSGRSPRRFRA